MSVAFGTVQAANGRSTTITATLPPAAVSGDLVRLVVEAAASGGDFSATTTGHTGWTKVTVARGTTTDTSAASRVAVYWRVLDGSGSDAFVATLPTATASWQTHANVVTGADNTSPVDTFAASAETTGTSLTRDAPTLTPARNGLLVVTGSWANGTAGTIQSLAFPVGMTEIADTQESTNQRTVLGQATKAATAGVATGAQTVTLTTAGATTTGLCTAAVWAEPAAAASANVRIAGAWVSKPIKARVSGAWQ